MKAIGNFLIILFLFHLFACGKKKSDQTSVNQGTLESISDDSLMNLVQFKTFQFFWEGAEPNSGMARERLHVDGDYPRNDKNVVTTGGSGFGLMAILVGIERGYISRQEGLQRLQKIVDFLETADRFHGIWPHWLNGETGKVEPFSKKDDGADGVESAFLFQGLLTVRQYFQDGNEAEKALANQIDNLWKEAEWDWFTQGENVLYWHWSPNYGWEMDHEVRGYNECLIYYVLAASSPTHSIDPEVYHQGWARGGEIDSNQVSFGYELELHSRSAPEYGGPLFWAHYSYLGLDPRNLTDRYANYWDHNVAHTMINRQHCIENPHGYEGYGEDCWGLTSSYSIKGLSAYFRGRNEEKPDPEPGTNETGYAGHKPAMDLGVIAPTAALSSMPYAPDEVMKVMRHFHDDLGDKLMGPYGFYDAFSKEYDWWPDRYLAIDQGPIVVMIENHRTGLIWELFMSAPEVQQGLNKLGFSY